MENKQFINEFFTNAINSYLDTKLESESPTFSSFPVIVIRSLIAIYGELDIINPYRTKNEIRMGGFDSNIMKFGFSQKKLNDFKSSLEKYDEIGEEGKNPYFVKIEKYLIDMFAKKITNVSMNKEEMENFEKLLYLSTNPNEIMQRDLNRNTQNKTLIDEYYQSKIFEASHHFKLLPYKKNTLLPEAYTVLGYTLESIASMDEITLNNLNNQIFSFFHIEISDQNKMNRLKEAVSYYKKYGNALTSGNGYVDMLLLVSVIATVMMGLFAITVRVLR